MCLCMCVFSVCCRDSACFCTCAAAAAAAHIHAQWLHRAAAPLLPHPQRCVVRPHQREAGGRHGCLVDAHLDQRAEGGAHAAWEDVLGWGMGGRDSALAGERGCVRSGGACWLFRARALVRVAQQRQLRVLLQLRTSACVYRVRPAACAHAHMHKNHSLTLSRKANHQWPTGVPMSAE